jgi:hypothetical protein
MPTSFSTGAIIGISIGGTIGVICVLGLIGFYIWRVGCIGTWSRMGSGTQKNRVAVLLEEQEPVGAGMMAPPQDENEMSSGRITTVFDSHNC